MNEWISLDGGEFGWSGSTDTNLTVSNWLVSHGVFGQVVSNHVSLDFNWVPVFSTININDGTAHLWDDNAVSKMSFDTLWLFTLWGVLLGDSELSDKSIVLTAVLLSSESSLLSWVHELENIVVAHFEELVEFVTSVDLLSERFLFDLLSFRHLISIKNQL